MICIHRTKEDPQQLLPSRLVNIVLVYTCEGSPSEIPKVEISVLAVMGRVGRAVLCNYSILLECDHVDVGDILDPTAGVDPHQQKMTI